MRNKLDELLKNISDLLVVMSTVCEESLTTTFEAFKAHDKEKALSIYKRDYDLNARAREIEELCIKTLLRQQPVAHDMLIISATLKLVADVKRIGTQAISIAEIISTFDFSLPQGDDMLLVEKMSEEAIFMVKGCIESFIKHDDELARKVLKRDSVVDKYFAMVRTALVQEIRHSKDDAGFCLDILMIAKYLERIGDHACNVAKSTQFVLTGKLSEE